MKFNELYKSPGFQKAIDICRILTVVLLIIILVYLFLNIENVKILNQDVCRICEQKTKSVCLYLDYLG